MKKLMITLVSIIALAALPVFAATGVWTAVGGGGSNGGGSCYLVTASVTGGGTFMGTGVVSGGTFTGLLKLIPNPVSSTSSNKTAYYDAGNGTNVYYGGNPSSVANYVTSGYVVSVQSMAISSAQPIACW